MPEKLPDYEKDFHQQLQENRDLVLQQVQNQEQGMMKKIQTYCDCSGYSKPAVIQKIKNDKMFSFWFAKDPAKQNIFENSAKKYIESIEQIFNFKKLPSSGKNAKHISSSGAVMDGKELKESGGSTDAKSIDFYWECADKEFYAFHKYTRESGGFQDSQYRDIKAFIEGANRSTCDKHFFIAIADGNYYDGQSGQAGISKIEALKNLANDKHGVYAVKITELFDLLKKICAKY